jgi:hypothetical protein
MSDEASAPRSLGDNAARQLANATKTVPQFGIITPRWLVRCLQWIPVEAGVFRLNRVKDASSVTVDCSARDERELPGTYVNYDEKPREYLLCAVTTVVDIHTRVSDLYSVPHNQIHQQLRLAIEAIKERQESELVNNTEYGLLSSAAVTQKVSNPHRCTDARRSRRTHHEGLEGAGLLPRSSGGDSGVRARGHAPRRSARYRESVRFAVSHLARHSDRSVR